MMLKGYFTEHRRLWLGLCSVFFLVAAWELVLTYIFPVNPFFFTKPSLIAAAFKEQIQGAKLWHDLAVSSQAFIWGFSFAVIVGIPRGPGHGLEKESRILPRSLPDRALR